MRNSHSTRIRTPGLTEAVTAPRTIVRGLPDSVRRVSDLFTGRETAP